MLAAKLEEGCQAEVKRPISCRLPVPLASFRQRLAPHADVVTEVKEEAVAPRDWNPNELVVMGIAFLAILGLTTLVIRLAGQNAGEYTMIVLWALLILVPLLLLGVKGRWFDRRKKP